MEFGGWVVVLGSMGAAGGTLGLIWFLYSHQDGAGPAWFIGALGAQALWILSYTAGLLVYDPFWRASAEALMWVAIAWLGPLFLGFALVYTGRGVIVRSWGFRTLFVVPAATLVLALTHPFHTFLWKRFYFEPIFGLGTVQYTVQPWAYFVAVFSFATTSAGVFLLLETINSYGPLYRREALAVGFSTIAPATAFGVWLLEIGPWPALCLAPVMFLPHVMLDAYAFGGTHMFETNPTTQRAAERSALSDLRDPLLVIDPSHAVVNLNEQAQRIFGTEDRLPVSLTELLGTDLDSLRERGEFTLTGSSDRVYAISYTELSDSRGGLVGGILVFYDITDERRREQRLSVLNRILRHNVSNKLTVTQGRARMIQSETDDPAIATHVQSLINANEQLLSITRNVRAFEKIQERGVSVTAGNPLDSVDAVVSDIAEEYPDSTFDVVDELEDTRLETDFEIVELVLRNLVRNAAQHAEDSATTVEISVTTNDTGTAVFEVRDSNEQIPEVEIDTLSSDAESSLQHGEGIGLWISRWCVDLLNGELSFGYQDGNVVRVSIPRDAA